MKMNDRGKIHIANAVEAELSMLKEHVGDHLPDGRLTVVRNGYLPEWTCPSLTDILLKVQFKERGVFLMLKGKANIFWFFRKPCGHPLKIALRCVSSKDEGGDVMKDKELFAQLLGLTPPWEITDMKVDYDALQIHI